MYIYIYVCTSVSICLYIHIHPYTFNMYACKYIMMYFHFVSLRVVVVPMYDTLGPETVSYIQKQTGAATVLCTAAEVRF